MRESMVDWFWMSSFVREFFFILTNGYFMTKILLRRDEYEIKMSSFWYIFYEEELVYSWVLTVVTLLDLPVNLIKKKFRSLASYNNLIANQDEANLTSESPDTITKGWIQALNPTINKVTQAPLNPTKKKKLQHNLDSPPPSIFHNKQTLSNRISRLHSIKIISLARIPRKKPGIVRLAF